MKQSDITNYIPHFHMTWQGRGGGWGEEAWRLPGIEDLTLLTRKNMQKRLTKETKKKNNLLRFPAASRLCSGCPATASPQGPGFITKAVPGLIQPGLLWNNTKAPARLSMPQVHNSFQSYWRHFWEQGIPSADRDDLWMSRGLTAVVTHYTQTDTDTQRHTLVTSRTLWPAQPNCAYKHWETPLSGTLRFKVGERLKTRTMPCVRSICTSKFL